MVSIINGDVQAIRKDRKAVEVLGNWYNSRFKVLDDIEKGDYIKIEFTENKGYNNIKSYEIMPREIKPSKIETSDKDKTAVMLTAYVKDLMVAVLSNSENIKDKKLLLEIYDELNKLVIESYRRIKKEL